MGVVVNRKKLLYFPLPEPSIGVVSHSGSAYWLRSPRRTQSEESSTTSYQRHINRFIHLHPALRTCYSALDWTHALVEPLDPLTYEWRLRAKPRLAIEPAGFCPLSAGEKAGAVLRSSPFLPAAQLAPLSRQSRTVEHELARTSSSVVPISGPCRTPPPVLLCRLTAPAHLRTPSLIRQPTPSSTARPTLG